MDRDEITHRAMKAIRRPFGKGSEGDKAAAVAMWSRIAQIDLSERPLDHNESEFIVAVARALLEADTEDAKARPGAIVAACGLKGRKSSVVSKLVLDYLTTRSMFDDIVGPSRTPTPEEIFEQVKGSESLKGMSAHRIRADIAKALDTWRKG